ITGDEHELLSHHAAEALVDEVADDLVAFEVTLALGGEIASEGLQHPDLVLAAQSLRLLRSGDGAGAERQRDDTDGQPRHALHPDSPPGRDGAFIARHSMAQGAITRGREPVAAAERRARPSARRAGPRVPGESEALSPRRACRGGSCTRRRSWT